MASVLAMRASTARTSDTAKANAPTRATRRLKNSVPRWKVTSTAPVAPSTETSRQAQIDCACGSLKAATEAACIQ